MKYDLFLSHAVEDKATVADAFYNALLKMGISVWYSKEDLQSGKDLTDSFDEAIKNSRFAVALITTRYLKAGSYSRKELNVLTNLESYDKSINLLVVNYKITNPEIIQSHSLIGAKYSLRIEDDLSNLENVARRIAEQILPEKIIPKKPPGPSLKPEAFNWNKTGLISIPILIFGLLGWLISANSSSAEASVKESIENAINIRAEQFDKEMTNRFNMDLAKGNVKSLSKQEAQQIFPTFTGYTGEYVITLMSKGNKYTGRKAVNEQGIITSLQEIYVDFDIEDPDRFLMNDSATGQLSYIIINKEPVHFEIQSIPANRDSQLQVTVNYRKNIRGVNLTLNPGKKMILTFYGFPSQETYLFSKQEDSWHLKGVKEK